MEQALVPTGRTQTRFAALLAAGVVLIAAFHLVASLSGWYYALPWLDIPMHLAGGSWLSAFFVYLFILRRNYFTERPFFVMLLFILGLAAFVGVSWELYEHLGDLFWAHHLSAPVGVELQHGVADTMHDLANDLIGATAGFLLLWRSYIRRT